MVIDFRIRPPYKGFMNLGIVRNWQSVPDDPRKMRPTGFDVSPSLRWSTPPWTCWSTKEGRRDHQRRTARAAHRQRRYGDVSNAEVNELLLRYPGLFVALAGISPNAPDALEEIEHCVRDWGFKGVALDPGWCSPAMYATDPKIEPILDLCQQLGVFVSITMSAYGGPDLSYCDPTPLVPMLRKFPKVNVVIPHGCWPKVQEAVGVALLCPNSTLPRTAISSCATCPCATNTPMLRIRSSNTASSSPPAIPSGDSRRPLKTGKTPGSNLNPSSAPCTTTPPSCSGFPADPSCSAQY